MRVQDRDRSVRLRWVLRHHRWCLSLLWLFAAACADGTADTPARLSKAASPAVAAAAATNGDLAVGSWNIEWFGDRSNGPGDEALQLRNATTMLGEADADVWGIAEIVDDAQWRRLIASMPGYAGVLASDPRVARGGAYYSAREQKLGVLYRTSRLTLTRAAVVLTASDDDFAGRPPLEVRFARRGAGANTDPALVLLVVHLKARADAGSWERRRDAAGALKRYLDREHARTPVLVVGDWNDGIDGSITNGRPSPFAAFVRDTARYRFLTADLARRGATSTTGYGTLIDHHLASDELAAGAARGGAIVVQPTTIGRRYRSTTSDHYPVVSHFRFGHD